MLMVGRQIQSIIGVLLVVLWVGSSYNGVNQLTGILRAVLVILYSVLTSQYKSMQPKTWDIAWVRNHLLIIIIIIIIIMIIMTCFTSKAVWGCRDLCRL